MELVTFTIPRKRSNHEPVYIAPIGDIQFSGKRGPTAMDALKRHLDRCQKLNAYYLGLGDYTDFMSPSNRQRMRAAALYDTAEDVIDDKAMDLVQELYDSVLRPTKGRWLGLLEGHHFATLKTGETTDQRLCQMLGARFLGTSAMIRLQFVTNECRNNLVLWAHHGTGGGMKACAPLNKLENLAPYWGGIDVFLMGHTTKMPVVPINRVEARWHGRGAPDLVHRKVYFVNTGGFSKAFIQGSLQGRTPRGGYAEQKMLNPAVVGAPIIRIAPYEKWHRGAVSWSPEVSIEI